MRKRIACFVMFWLMTGFAVAAEPEPAAENPSAGVQEDPESVPQVEEELDDVGRRPAPPPPSGARASERFEPTEKVRADVPVSFPTDI